jgi:fibronectin type 3 domain-containing protein
MLDIRKGSWLVIFGLFLLVATAVSGCGGDDDPARPAVDTVAPAIPDGLAAWNVDSQGVTLTWSANVSDPDLAGYLVYRSESRSGPFRPLRSDPVTSNSWTDAHTERGHTYYYRVSARDTSNNESALSQVHTIRIPEAPGRDDELAGP